LRLEDGEGCDFSLTSNKDIKQFLKRTKANIVRRLEGKLVEAWVDEGLTRAISVNERLI
jgi:hypothetical protein